MTQTVKATLSVNGIRHDVSAHPDTPLLWILREHLKLTGTKYGCGKGQCGACTVHLDGRPALSCQYVMTDIGARAITTIEGLSETGTHPMQQAWVAEQVPQCGYCQSGQIMRAVGLLKEKPKPTRDEIVQYMKPNLCRCGSYHLIMAAIERAAKATG
jgi:isoquinoline 1-oxidoreductase alpha subunit